MPTSEWTSGTVIDGFRLEQQLPLATTAAFWRVSRADSDMPLLMKIPRLEHGANPINIVGFEVEQMILSKLSGPHVPRFVASGGLENPYIVMELIVGDSLRDCLPKLPLKADEVAAIGSKIASALHDIHRQSVIHLDLKPSNVMLRNGEAVLIDFGFSRHAQLPDLLAEEIPGPIGTGPYIAPEQLFGNRSDPRSDIFALGVILYFFATGERPFGDPHGAREWRRRLYYDPIPPRALRPDCPASLQELILRCLEIDPAQRHATAAQLAFDLQHLQQVAITSRGERSRRNGPMGAVARWIAGKRLLPTLQQPFRRQLDKSPIIMAAIDLAPGAERLAEALGLAVGRILQTHPDARLTCVNVLRLSRVALDPTEDEQGRNLHLRRLAELQYWARGLPVPAHGITYHVFEAVSPAAALLDYARSNHVDHIVLGAAGSSRLRRYLGSVSSQVVAEAPCTVTVVRVRDTPA
jgi:nucleotide-binding universal stress UspA family protein